MPSVVQTILAAVHAAAFAAFLCTSFTTIHALASPLALALPLPIDYSPRMNRTAARDTTARKRLRTKHATQHNQTEHTMSAMPEDPELPPASAPPPKPASPSTPLLIPSLGTRTLLTGRGRNTEDRGSMDKFDMMQRSYHGANDNSNELKELAHRSSSVKDDDKDFQQQSALALTGFQGNVLDFQTLLKDLGKERGVAYYDRENDLETLLKEIVNLHKHTLTYIDVLCYNLPVLGPILGPIVYDIKCLLDDVLNACENLTDAILNAINPILRPLIKNWTATSCGLGLGLNALDICL